ncbi:MAG: DegT/DnrJ/EryC1/StrS aminotransferase family protein [Xanthobacteraceae bacterium]|nr:DegT/DnrJ/EryC1/StrS aminotransferase family protein [Xanthobacteraceae bacterium]
MIPIYRPYLTGVETEYVQACLQSTWISSRGEFIDKFETGFANFIGANFATSVCNGTVALHLALLAVGICPGDEVIVPTLTYVASANMISHAGATPVFVDSLDDDWQVDPQAIERAITPKTKAVMVVHLYGGACDLDAIAKLCKAHGLLLIADCAEAFGTRYHGVSVGVLADVATYSFFGNKTITTGEGGMVVSNCADVIKRARHLKGQAVSPTETQEYWHDMLGFNYRMTNICAALGLAQLEHAEAILEKKRHIAAWYDRYLNGLPVRRQALSPGTDHSWWLYSMRVSKELRDSLRKYLRVAGIETRSVFPPVHTFPHYALDINCPIAADISEGGISLPSYPDLTEEDIFTISSKIEEFFSSAKSDHKLDLALP